jgi:putative ABC transport system permease protein
VPACYLRLIRAGFQRYATYRQAVVAGMATNLVFGFMRCAVLLTVFAGTALALTAIGIFGVVSYSVQQRVREIGVRVALGASSRDVLRLIVGRSLAFVASGAVIGVVGALGLTRFLSGLLFDVTAQDPLTFSFAVATLLAVAFVASYVPAKRATRIDPVTALRLE